MRVSWTLLQTTNSLRQIDIRSCCQNFQKVSLVCLDLNLTLQASKLLGCLWLLLQLMKWAELIENQMHHQIPLRLHEGAAGV